MWRYVHLTLIFSCDSIVQPKFHIPCGLKGNRWKCVPSPFLPQALIFQRKTHTILRFFFSVFFPLKWQFVHRWKDVTKHFFYFSLFFFIKTWICFVVSLTIVFKFFLHLCNLCLVLTYPRIINKCIAFGAFGRAKQKSCSRPSSTFIIEHFK